MKWGLCCVLLSVVAGAGCLDLPVTHHVKKPAEVAKPAPARPAPPAVNADQVTPENARDQAKALREEMEWSAKQEPAAEKKPADAPKKGAKGKDREAAEG